MNRKERVVLMECASLFVLNIYTFLFLYLSKIFSGIRGGGTEEKFDIKCLRWKNRIQFRKLRKNWKLRKAQVLTTESKYLPLNQIP